MNENIWEELSCDYFIDTCRKELNTYLNKVGLTERENTPCKRLVYTRLDTFLEINYDVNLFPDYTIRVTVGLCETIEQFIGVPMWYLLPNSHPYHSEVYWTFKSREELIQVIGEIKEEFLEVVAVPLLQSHNELRRKISSFQSE